MTAVVPQLSAPSEQSNLNEITRQPYNTANDRRDDRHKLSADTAKQTKRTQSISTAQLFTREEEACRTTNMIFQHAEAEQTNFQLATIIQSILEVIQFSISAPHVHAVLRWHICAYEESVTEQEVRQVRFGHSWVLF
ncbi:hypothetical protein N7522_013911 [Penicillium canescens]|nr:hypothetical protein N7522_013911 [Penicillium canescens]